MRAIAGLLSTFALTALLAGGSAATLEAQESHHYDADWTWPENERARLHIQQGDEAMGKSEFAEARRHYELAAEKVRDQGEFPALAVHRQAAAFYYEEQYQNAISTLDRLADEAARHGDVATQVWALADEAWIQGQRGMEIDMERTVDRVHKLLKSPYLPHHIKKEIKSKRLGEATTMGTGMDT